MVAGQERSSLLATPRLKELAAEGQILTSFYSPRAICTPSRQAILSGRDPIRFSAVDHLMRIYASSSSRGGYPQSEYTVAEALRDGGYVTGYTGKWHMGMGDGIDPHAYAAWNHGFDEVSFWLEGSNGEGCHEGNQNVGFDPSGGLERDYNFYHMCTFSHVWYRPLCIRSRAKALRPRPSAAPSLPLTPLPSTLPACHSAPPLSAALLVAGMGPQPLAPARPRS